MILVCPMLLVLADAERKWCTIRTPCLPVLCKDADLMHVRGPLAGREGYDKVTVEERQCWDKRPVDAAEAHLADLERSALRERGVREHHRKTGIAFPWTCRSSRQRCEHPLG